MLRWILALLSIPFLDAILLGAVVVYVDAIGFLEMVALVVLTGFVGLLLVRAEGRRTLRKMQRRLAAGEPPTDELLDGGLLIAAGAFLLTPGLVTDAIGFLIAIPLTRIPIRLFVKRVVVTPYLDRKTGGFATGQVWTAGFPDGSSQQDASPSDSGTVNLGADSYRIDPDDVTQNEDGSYTIDESGETDARPDDSDDRDAVGR
ncbi:phage T7 F exclusion suppressor FxsA [Halovivax asiaticus JCM 14624]|uniref:Phage T7 F exclusion suppressor FxsA n=1 Tax=Halovivax asiaticus JCM 14624 TaxID=1227490 RepID=M0BRR5_9EURY|nr:FxsA family protein [Halovivax asiaticus]ELZ13696.1 phage T7 F exclusion suppressor FxsA [Halovivax asiaticus JCM 14624]